MTLSLNKIPFLFSTILSILLALIFFSGIPIEQRSIVFIPWDGFVFRDYENIINYNKLTSNSLEYTAGLLDYLYQNLFISTFGNYPYITRIVPILISSWIVSYVIFVNFFEEKNLSKNIALFLLILILYTCIPFQWLINDGVMYSLSFQLVYLIYLLIIINTITSNYSSDKFYKIYVLTSFLVLCMLWTFSLVVTISLFILLFIFPFLLRCILQNKIIVNDKLFLSNILINFILFIFLAYYFYLSITYNNFGIEYSEIEDSSAGLRDATYGSIWGGLFTQMAGLSDWTMYQSWPNRLFGSMDFLFPSRLPQIYSVSLYFIGLILFVKKPEKSIALLFIFIFVCLFFSKGIQPPFGIIYYELLHSFKFFQAIRTPDTKFGLYMLSAVVIINIYYLSNSISKYVSYLYIGLTSIYLFCVVPPLYSGITTNGVIDQTTNQFAYRVDPNSEAVLNQALKDYDSRNIAGVVMPGLGNILMPDGWHGYREYLDLKYRYLLNYTRAKEGPLGDLISVESCDSFILWSQVRKISYVVLRLSATEISEYKKMKECLASPQNGYIVKYSDQYTTLFERNEILRIEDEFENPKLTEIINKILGIKSKLLVISVLIILNLLYFYRKRVIF